eukprot:318494_1
MGDSQFWTNGTISVHYGWFSCIVLYLLMIVLIMEASRRFRAVQICLYWIMPFILIPITFIYNDIKTTLEIFMVIKLFSVIFGIWLVQFIRHQLDKFSQTFCSVLIWFVYFVLFINVSEAMITEFIIITWKYRQKRFIFPGNAIHGFILLLTQANPLNITSNNEYKCMQYKLGSMYLFNYTLWNIIFCFSYFIEEHECFQLSLDYILSAICDMSWHLGVPLIMLLWTNNAEWLQYRAYSLFWLVWFYQYSPIQYYIPFFKMNSDIQCVKTNEMEENIFLFLSVINYISFICAVIFLCKDIFEEIKSWNGSYDKSHDTSLLQWIVSSLKPRNMHLDHIELHENKTYVESPEPSPNGISIKK